MRSKICRDLNAFRPEELILIQREIDFATKIACGSIERPLKPGESIDVGNILNDAAHTEYIDKILPQVRDSNAAGETELERDAAENYRFVKDYSGLSGDPETFTYEEILAGVKTEQAKPGGFKKKELALNIRSSAFLHAFALNPEIKDETKVEPTTAPVKPWNAPLVGAFLVVGAAGLGYVALRNAVWGLRILGWGAAWGSAIGSCLLEGVGFSDAARFVGLFEASRFGRYLGQTPRIPYMWRGLGLFLFYFASRPVLSLGVIGVGAALVYGVDLYLSGKDPNKSWLKKQAVKYVDPIISRFL